MRRLTMFLLFPALAIFSVLSQEPKANYFDDYVFKTPVAYKTGYNNDTERIIDIWDAGPYTAMEFTDVMTTVADSADVYVHPYDFLYDPVNDKRYYMVSSSNIPRFRGMKYVKGKAGQTTKHALKYTILFERIPADVKYVEFHHAPDWESPDKCYAQRTFYDIDLTKRGTPMDEDCEWINTDPQADQLRYFTPLTVVKKKGSEEGKSNVLLNLAYRMVNRNSKYESSKFRLDNDFSLYDPVRKRAYPSLNIYGYPDGKEIWIKGWDIMAFGYYFKDVDSDVEVVDVMKGDICIIKGLRLK